MEEPFDMENHLKEVIDRMGGAFKATALLQKRLKALNQGAQKLVDVTSRNQFDIAFAELLEEKIALGDIPESQKLAIEKMMEQKWQQ